MRAVIKKRKQTTEKTGQPAGFNSNEHILTTEIIRNYSMIIGSRISYFNQLSPVQKLRFIKRVQVFMASRNFHFKGLKENYEMPIW